MTLVNPKPLGYALNEILPSDDVNSAFEQLPDAVDGAGGGPYSPSAAIVLAAKGVQVSGIFDAPGIGFYNVKRAPYNAVGDNATDDTAAIQAAEDAVAATDGGDLFFPPGTYEIRADLVKKHKVNWWAIPGTVTITMDHATENFLTFTGSAWTREALIYGINFEATQSNSGNFCIDTGTLFKLRFKYCNLNKAAALLTGRLFSSVASSELALEDCDFRAVKTNDNHFAQAKLQLIRGQLTMAPGATSELILPVNEVFVSGTRFVHVSTVGNVAFFNISGGNTRVEGAVFDVDDSGAGASTYAFRVAGGVLRTSDCDFESDVAPYEYVSLAGAGSVLQLLPHLRVETAAGADVTLPDGYQSFIIEAAKATAPTIFGPNVLYAGQPLNLILRNVSGGTWAGNPSFSGKGVETANLSGLLDDDYITVSLAAVDVNDDGTAMFFQTAMPGTVD